MRWRALLFVSLFGSSAFALDKQGSAHGGSVGGETQGVGISGAVIGSVAEQPGQCYYRDRYGRRYIDSCPRGGY